MRASDTYIKSFRFWRLTFSITLPIWVSLIWPWLSHPIASMLEHQRLKRLQAFEAKWDALFLEAFKERQKPEFEFDERHPGRVIGLKETKGEALLPSVGVWAENENSLRHAIDSSGLAFPMDPAPEDVVVKRRTIIDAVRYGRVWGKKK